MYFQLPIKLYKTSTSVKQFIDNWNIQSSLWLRRVAYVRLPRFKTFGVFMLSAFWHGIYFTKESFYTISTEYFPSAWQHRIINF